MLDDLKVPVPRDERDAEAVTDIVLEVGEGILGQAVRADALARGLLDLRLPHRLPGRGAS